MQKFSIRKIILFYSSLVDHSIQHLICCRSYAGVFLPHAFKSSDSYVDELCSLTHCSLSDLVVTHLPALAVSLLPGLTDHPTTGKFKECDRLLAKCSKVLRPKELQVSDIYSKRFKNNVM